MTNAVNIDIAFTFASSYLNFEARALWTPAGGKSNTAEPSGVNRSRLRAAGVLGIGGGLFCGRRFTHAGSLDDCL